LNKKTIEVMLLVIGIVLMAYSSVSNSLAQSSATNIISTYQEHISGLDSNTKEEMQQKIDEYNQKVSGEKEVNITLEDDYENYEEYYNSVDINGLIGYISIPKINIYLPIYHGVADSTLAKGIGHLKETSLPYGGESTHAALAGHTGLSKQKMFDDIDKLVEGDEFQIYVLDKVLTYKVDKISIVDPNDVSQIQIEEGKDYVTLITCTPRLVNTHRLLVRGVRVPDKVQVAAESKHQESEIDMDALKRADTITTIKYISIYGIIFVVLLVYILSEPTRRARTVGSIYASMNHKSNYKEQMKELRSTKAEKEVKVHNKVHKKHTRSMDRIHRNYMS